MRARCVRPRVLVSGAGAPEISTQDPKTLPLNIPNLRPLLAAVEAMRVEKAHLAANVFMLDLLALLLFPRKAWRAPTPCYGAMLRGVLNPVL